MATLIELDGTAPRIAEDAYIAPTAVLIGDVVVEERASVWFGAVLRGDNSQIRVGAGSCVQDNCVIHCAEDLPTVIGANVTVGHIAMLEGCVIEDGALIGMGAIVLQRARVGAGALVAAGAVVGEGVEIPAGMLAAGVPATVKKALGGSSERWVESGRAGVPAQAAALYGLIEALEEAADDVELERVERVEHAAQVRRLAGVRALRGLQALGVQHHADLAPVGLVAFAVHVAGVFEPVDHAGHAAALEPGQLGQPARRQRPLLHQVGHELHVAHAEAELVGHLRVEHDHVGDGPDERVLDAVMDISS